MKKLVVLFLIIFLITNVYASCNETQIDINTANAEDLDKIIWVGPVTADKIISYREENIFDSLDELINVSGIGEKKLINITEQGLACVDEEIQDEEEENSEESEQTFDKEEDTNEIDEEDEEENEKEDKQKEDEEHNIPENIYVKNLTLKTIELNTNSKDIKSVDNKKILKRNLAFAGIVTFCVTFGGALFLLNTRRRKSEFN